MPSAMVPPAKATTRFVSSSVPTRSNQTSRSSLHGANGTWAAAKLCWPTPTSTTSRSRCHGALSHRSLRTPTCCTSATRAARSKIPPTSHRRKCGGGRLRQSSLQTMASTSKSVTKTATRFRSTARCCHQRRCWPSSTVWAVSTASVASTWSRTGLSA